MDLEVNSLIKLSHLTFIWSFLETLLQETTCYKNDGRSSVQAIYTCSKYSVCFGLLKQLKF